VGHVYQQLGLFLCQGKSSTGTEIENKINTDLENVHKWLIANKLTLNQEKTECMLVGSRQRLQQSNSSNPQIVIGNHIIQQVSSKKVLSLRSLLMNSY
jgi:hypothetical protein